MSDEEFLRTVLKNLEPPRSQIDSLIRLRDNIDKCIKDNMRGYKGIFIAGSFKKRTMIKRHYDLDMLIIWDPDYIPLKNIKELFYKLKNALNTKWTRIWQKRVGWRIPYENEFHVDVIPSIEDKNAFRFSYLYNSYEKTTLRTSMKIHMEHIEKYDCRDLIKLLKLWKYRRDVPIKTFLLEIIIHQASYNFNSEDLSDQIDTVLEYIAKNIVNRDYYDPANTDNIITANLTRDDRFEIRDKAYEALNRDFWGQIFKNIRY